MDTRRNSGEGAESSSIGVAYDTVACIASGRGTIVRVEAGSVWLVQQGIPRDVLLSAGQSFRIECDGLTLVTVIGAPFALMTLERAAPARRGVAERMRGALGGLVFVRSARRDMKKIPLRPRTDR
jgi:hypothetical protein